MSKLNVSAEDCIAVVDLATPELAPDARLMGPLGGTAAKLKAWEVVWDLRGAKGSVYNDIVAAYGEAASESAVAPTVLASPGYEQEVESALRPAVRQEKLKVLGARGKALPKRPLDLAPFAEDWLGSAKLVTPSNFAWELGVDEEDAEALMRGEVDVAIQLGIVPGDDEGNALEILDEIMINAAFGTETYIRVEEEVEDERAALLDRFLRQIASNSLLAQLALVGEEGRISVVPMHGNGLHELDCGSELLAVRPARRGAAQQWARFASAIDELEALLNKPGVKEAEIESLLARNPLFLRGLNYAECYHQVILPLEQGRYLKPDVVVEPISDGWCDVVDLKLPSERIFVGGGERPRLSQAIAEAASQLRQYSRWFDDRKVAKAVEEQYGFRCFKPRQVVIIGRDPREFSETQREAARSAYPDLEIVTYDKLLSAAKSRLLL
jgi:hypothetical protein